MTIWVNKVNQVRSVGVRMCRLKNLPSHGYVRTWPGPAGRARDEKSQIGYPDPVPPPLLSFRRFSMSILLIVFWSRFGQVGPPLELPLIGFAKNIRFYLHKEFGAAAIRFYLHKEFRAAEIRFYLHKEFRAAEIRFYLHKEFRAAEIRFYLHKESLSLNKNREKSMMYVKNFPRCARQFVKNFLRKIMTNQWYS